MTPQPTENMSTLTMVPGRRVSLFVESQENLARASDAEGTGDKERKPSILDSDTQKTAPAFNLRSGSPKSVPGYLYDFSASKRTDSKDGESRVFWSRLGSRQVQLNTFDSRFEGMAIEGRHPRDRPEAATFRAYWNYIKQYRKSRKEDDSKSKADAEASASKNVDSEHAKMKPESG